MTLLSGECTKWVATQLCDWVLCYFQPPIRCYEGTTPSPVHIPPPPGTNCMLPIWERILQSERRSRYVKRINPLHGNRKSKKRPLAINAEYSIKSNSIIFANKLFVTACRLWIDADSSQCSIGGPSTNNYVACPYAPTYCRRSLIPVRRE